MQDHWELLDVFKALLALAAGFILGLERERKDKAAGLKTITIICLGATLFAIISMKLDTAHPTALAAYIVSGVGFIGAGAIFRDGFTVSGLTTAGIIWLAAAVGTSIGFGEFYLAATFTAASLLIVAATPLFNWLASPTAQIKQLKFTLAKKDFEQKDSLIELIRQQAITVQEKRTEVTGNTVEITADVHIENNRINSLRQLLVQHSVIHAFSL